MLIPGKHTFTHLAYLRGKCVFTLSISLAIPCQENALLNSFKTQSIHGTRGLEP
jgi:hypothetical protein